MESAHTLAPDAKRISYTLSALIDWLSSYVEQRPAEMLTRQFTAPRRSGAQPPAPPNITGVASVADYHGKMLQWLGDIRAALKRIPAGATAVALAGLASDAVDAASAIDVAVVDATMRATWQAMSLAELVIYVNNVDEAARLLAFYCAFLETL